MYKHEGQPKGLMRYELDDIAHSFDAPVHQPPPHTHVQRYLLICVLNGMTGERILKSRVTVPPAPSQFLITLGIANCL